MAHLYITCGLPFAGKTTLAQRLAQRFGWQRISLDDINSERELGQAGRAISQADWARSYAEAHRRLDAALAQGLTIIYDATNFQRKERDRLYALAQRYAIPVTVIYLDVAPLARRRWQDNRHTTTRYDVPDADYAQVADNFQPPTEDEDSIIFDGSIALDQWIDSTFGERVVSG